VKAKRAVSIRAVAPRRGRRTGVAVSDRAISPLLTLTEARPPALVDADGRGNGRTESMSASSRPATVSAANSMANRM